MPSKRAGDDDEFVPSGGAVARGAKKHPVTEAVLRFAIEKRGPKAGPFVNKVFGFTWTAPTGGLTAPRGPVCDVPFVRIHPWDITKA